MGQRIEEEVSQEYIVKDFKVWEGSEDPKYGTKLSVSFSGISEPIDMTAKKFPVIGETEYGDIVDYTTQKGVARRKFKRQPRPEVAETSPAPKQTEGYWSDKDAGIKAQMAVKASANLWSNKEWTIKDIEETAKSLLNIVEKIKATSPEPITGEDEVHDFDPNDRDVINLADIPF